MSKKAVKSQPKKWRVIREIKERRTLNVSGHGRGLYLYLPKDLCEVYEINGGDRVKAQLLELFKPAWGAEGEEEKA